MNYNVKPINFKFNEYFNQGFEDFKKDFGDYLAAFIFTFLIAFIPFCSFLAIGNFFKFCRRKREGKNPATSEIFNFEDFMPYLTLQLILFGLMIVAYIPIMILGGIGAFLNDGGNEGASLISATFGILFILLLTLALFYLSIKSFYMIGLISLEGIKEFKTAWEMSKKMTKTNFLNILLFYIIVGFISQIGVLACVIGILLTAPLSYIMRYHAIEDGIQQIKQDELQEIGKE